MGYCVAKSYKDYTYDIDKAFERSGKLYVTATHKCDRCTNGVYVCRVENGQPVPHPAYNGVCLKCGGTGVLTKEIRLYTEAEFERMEKANEKAAEKKVMEKEEKMRAEAEVKRAKWLAENGFNENESTFIYFPDNSYEVKEELKKAGFRFSNFLLWHAATVPTGYEESCVEVPLSKVATHSAWGECYYVTGCRDIVDEILKGFRPSAANVSEWIGEEGEKIVDYPVYIKRIHCFENRFGVYQVVDMEDESGNSIVWFTKTSVEEVSSDQLIYLSGTVKSLDEYKEKKQTIMTRCTLKELN